MDDWLIDSELITPPPNPFIQNGVDHIHFAMDFPYGSDDMDVAFETLRPYIDEGKVLTMRCMACCVLRFRRRVGRVDPSYALSPNQQVSVMSTQTVHGPGWIGSDHPKACSYVYIPRSIRPFSRPHD